MSEPSPCHPVARRPSRAALVEAVAVLAFFTAVAVFATWPLARHPLSGFYGFGNDNLGTMWVYGWLHAAYFGPSSASFSPELQAPFGWPIPEQALQPADKLYALLFGGFDRGLGAYNTEIFLSFVLAGCTMYLLARYLTGSQLASAVAGFIYTFSPFHLAQSMQYGALASIQWLPLFLLGLLVLLRRRRLRDAAFLGVALALVTLTSYYQAWFLGWFTLVLLLAAALYAAFRARRARQLSRAAIRRLAWLGGTRAAVAGAVAVALTVPLVATSVGAASEHKTQLVHPLTEAIRYSGRPWMLFVPPHDNPIFGPHVRNWVQLHLYDNPLTDQSIYVGYVALALAAYGLLRRGGLRIVAGWETYLLGVGFFTGLLLVMGPYVPLDRSYWRLWANPDATHHVPSLGLAMFKIAPEFRFFSRAFVLVSLCLAALAAIGFARLERRLGGTRARIGLAALVVGLVGLEYTNAPPHVWAAEGNPAWVSAVRALPPARRSSTIRLRRSTRRARSTTCSGSGSTVIPRSTQTRAPSHCSSRVRSRLPTTPQRDAHSTRPGSTTRSFTRTFRRKPPRPTSLLFRTTPCPRTQERRTRGSTRCGAWATPSSTESGQLPRESPEPRSRPRTDSEGSSVKVRERHAGWRARGECSRSTLRAPPALFRSR